MLANFEVIHTMFVFACLWTKMEPMSINLEKKKKAEVLSHLNQTSLIKNLFNGFQGKFFLQVTVGRHKGAT